MSLDSIKDLHIFVRIVAAGSLSAAARELDLSLATVSKCLIRLEKSLGVRLANRSTRSLSLTAEGREFHAHSLTLVEQIRRAEEAMANRRDHVSGLVRITASCAFTRRQIAPRLGRLLERHPALKVELIATDDVVDIVKEGIDIAIRQAVLPDSELITRVIAADRRVLCAAPAYLARHDTPSSPEDLLHHACIVFGDPPITTWTFTQNGEIQTLDVGWSVHVSAGDAAHAAVLGGAGIVFKSVWEVAEDITAGRLVELLPDWKAPARPIHAVYPSIRHQTPRVRRVVDFLAEELKAAESELKVRG